jgi:hypothetical protein
MMPRQGMLGLRLWGWRAPLNSVIAPSTPFALWVDLTRGLIRAPGALEGRVLGMVGLQVLYGALMAALAAVTLRPSFRARSGVQGHRAVARSRRIRRPQHRIPCGDDPMLWKELFAARVPAAYRPLGLTIALVLGALLIWGTTDFAMPAFRELWSAGYGVAPPRSARGAFHDYLRIVCTGTYLIFALGVASDAAAGLTTEREKETWISLIATPLTGTEIVRAKLLGAIWGIRHVGLILAMLGFVGVLAGSVHPLGIILVFFELAAFIWFAAALGTWISLRSKDTMRAVALTMGWLLLANGGSLLLALAQLPSRALTTVGCTPLMIALSLASPGEVAGRVATDSPALFTHAAFAMLWGTHRTETVIACLLSVLRYGAAAWALTRAACRGFDARVDRPALSGPRAGKEVQGGPTPRRRARSLRKATSSARA